MKTRAETKEEIVTIIWETSMDFKTQEEATNQIMEIIDSLSIEITSFFRVIPVEEEVSTQAEHLSKTLGDDYD